MSNNFHIFLVFKILSFNISTFVEPPICGCGGVSYVRAAGWFEKKVGWCNGAQWADIKIDTGNYHLSKNWLPPIIMVLLSPLSHQLLQRWQITALWCFAVWCMASTALDAPGQCRFASWLSFGEPSLLELRCHRVETLRLSMVTLSWIPQNCLLYAESNSVVRLASVLFVALHLFRRTS